MIRRRRDARRRLAPVWSAEEWEQANLTLWLRCADRCWWCSRGLNGDGVRHHRQRRRDGGDRLCNIVILHAGCHNIAPLSVHQEPVIAMNRGFLVPSWDDPFTTPILIEGTSYLLDDAGQKILV